MRKKAALKIDNEELKQKVMKACAIIQAKDKKLLKLRLMDLGELMTLILFGITNFPYIDFYITNKKF